MWATVGTTEKMKTCEASTSLFFSRFQILYLQSEIHDVSLDAAAIAAQPEKFDFTTSRPQLSQSRVAACGVLTFSIQETKQTSASRFVERFDLDILASAPTIPGVDILLALCAPFSCSTRVSLDNALRGCEATKRRTAQVIPSQPETC
jgi:hypothetical protein